MGVKLELGQAVGGNETLKFQLLITEFGWRIGITDHWRTVARGFEQAAEQDGDVMGICPRPRAKLRQDFVNQIAIGTANIEKKIKAFSHELTISPSMAADQVHASKLIDVDGAASHKTAQWLQGTAPHHWPWLHQNRAAGFGQILYRSRRR